MISIAAQFRRLLGLSFVVALLLTTASPVGAVYASTNHMDDMAPALSSTDCARYCASVNAATTVSGVSSERDGIRNPDPEPLPTRAQYPQSSVAYLPRAITPGRVFSTSLIRPPDLVLVNATFRF
jgi:hypothetical protein